ncbi:MULTISPECIES: TraR/DksA C4-type zinc finger protein [unclassified Paenibacillus]|uniref:TraR/DksA C4-type zinc finger protein n=1 Tax=Paenibacillus provencensis TaxID=441151 RepID=A0ABW3PSU7_9BACL|nr:MULTISPECIES: TraR/DksA C4-type zinc finger protein [unclassified Paenibacillus]MCM3126279.1 TraR/DksA C4-type zinc finger protein [Paenibacillus sp. MER 78]SFS61194.1 regulatory protein, yteA family [Paenibacillus sp. 453mf]
MTHLTKQEWNSLKKQLLEQQHDIEQREKESDHYGLSGSTRYEAGELTTFDNHPGDVATEMYEREKDISLNEHDEFMLERIKSALNHMEEGDYGNCAVCSKPIPYERLNAVPYTIYCREHAPETSVSEDRPIEEEFLSPPFGRTSLDEKDTQNGFDGEDTWQILENYGNSNTPALQEGNNNDDYDAMYMEAAEEIDGCVEAYESFLATDIYGQNVSVVRNKQYRRYLENHEGMSILEPDVIEDDL